MEIQLANKLGVSRTPIREAIRKLELEGLVLMIPRKGAEVAQITEKNMQDVLEVRKALEELSVQLACERITPEQVEEMKMAAASLTTANASGRRSSSVSPFASLSLNSFVFSFNSSSESFCISGSSASI